MPFDRADTHTDQVMGGGKKMPAKLERCVQSVKARGGVANPWAVCQAALSANPDANDEQIVRLAMEMHLSDPGARFEGLLQFSDRIDLSRVIQRHANGDVTVEHQIAMPGEFVHPKFGHFTLNEKVFREWERNMQRDLDQGHQISITLGHPRPEVVDGAPAAGWFEGITVRDGLPFGKIRMLAATQEAIDRGEYKFYSPSFVTAARDQDRKSIGSRIVGGGITNIPFLVGMPALPTTTASPATLSDDMVASLWKERGHAGLLLVPQHITLSNVADVPGGTTLALGAEEEAMPGDAVLKALGAADDTAALETIAAKASELEAAVAKAVVVDKLMGMEQEGLPNEPGARLDHIIGLAFPAAPPPGDDKKKGDDKDKKELSDRVEVLEGTLTQLTAQLETQKGINTELADKQEATELSHVTEQARSDGKFDKADVPWFVPGDEVKTLAQFRDDPVFGGSLDAFKAHVKRTQPKRSMRDRSETGKTVLLGDAPTDDDSPGGQWIAAYRAIQAERDKAGRPITIDKAIELAKVQHPEVYEAYLMDATRNPNA